MLGIRHHQCYDNKQPNDLCFCQVCCPCYEEDTRGGKLTDHSQRRGPSCLSLFRDSSPDFENTTQRTDAKCRRRHCLWVHFLGLIKVIPFFFKKRLAHSLQLKVPSTPSSLLRSSRWIYPTEYQLPSIASRAAIRCRRESGNYQMPSGGLLIL